jgi:hypothetical protein
MVRSLERALTPSPDWFKIYCDFKQCVKIPKTDFPNALKAYSEQKMMASQVLKEFDSLDKRYHT